MSSNGSVTQWLAQLKAGDQAAAQPLWEGYYQRLVHLARQKLQGAPRRVADEEDVALSAFDSFCRGVEHGRFPHLADRNDLWRLLVVVTARKALDLVEYERRQKRGGGKVVYHNEEGELLADVLSREPTPEFAAQVADECRRLLEILKDPLLRSVALWKMDGYSNEEIAGKLGRTVPTVERKLRLIREQWSAELAS